MGNLRRPADDGLYRLIKEKSFLLIKVMPDSSRLSGLCAALGGTQLPEFTQDARADAIDGNGGAKLVHDSGGIVSLRAEQNSAT